MVRSLDHTIIGENFTSYVWVWGGGGGGDWHHF